MMSPKAMWKARPESDYRELEKPLKMYCVPKTKHAERYNNNNRYPPFGRPRFDSLCTREDEVLPSASLDDLAAPKSVGGLRYRSLRIVFIASFPRGDSLLDKRFMIAQALKVLLKSCVSASNQCTGPM